MTLRWRRRVGFAGAAFSLALGTWGALEPETKFAQIIDRWFFDTAVKLNAGTEDPLANSSVLAFDNESLRVIGYPIDRSIYEKLLARLPEKPRAVALDFIFGQSTDRKSTLSLSEALDRFPGVILAGVRDDQNRVDGPLPPVAGEQRMLALTDAFLDEDGLMRWYPLLIPTTEGEKPSLGFALLLAEKRETAKSIKDTEGRIESIQLTAPDGTIRQFDVRADTSGMGRIALIPRAPSSAIRDLSWADLLAAPAGALDADRAYVFASTADGLRAHQGTALDPVQAPAHNHLFAYETLSANAYLRPAPMPTIIFVLINCIFLRALTRRLPPSYSATGLSVLALLILVLLAHLLFWRTGFLWRPAAVVVSILTAGPFMILVRWFSEDQRRRALMKSFANYLHPSLVQKLAAGETEVTLSGEERELTVMFSDLRNFTSLSEKVSSEALVEIMNDYFTLATRIVQKQSGTVDKFIGDAVMAFWNAPLDQPDHRILARIAALQLITEFDSFSHKWSATYGLLEPLRIGIGLHSGRAIVGNVGGADRFNYTALGDSVNTASRLEGICKAYGVSIVVSSSVLDQTDDQDWLQIDRIRVKGQAKSVELFTSAPKGVEWLAAWKEMRIAYDQGDFVKAKKSLNLIPISFAPRTTYERRFLDHATAPVGWDGIWNFSEK